MGSRKKKRKPTTAPTQYAKSVTFEDAGVHLPSFISGLVTSIMVILLVWNYFAGPSEPKTVQKQFELALEVADADQLSAILLDLDESILNSADEVTIESENRRRVDVSNKMLTMPLNPKQRELAVVSNIEALSGIYGLDYLKNLKGPKVSETLRSTAEKYTKDTNKQIVRVARLALLKHNAFERLKRDGYSPVSKVADEMVELLNDYSDHDMTIQTIKLVVNYYNENNLDEGLVIMNRILSGCESNPSPTVKALIQQYSDLVKLQTVGYVQRYENRWLNGSQGEQDLFDVSLQLLESPGFGERIVRRVDHVTQWFEQDGQYDRATKIYEQMLGSANAHENPEVAALAKSTAENGLTRLGLVNQKLEFSGVSHLGSPLDPDLFSDRAVVVLFWSADDTDSFEALKQIEVETQPWRLQGGRLLAVSPESTVGEEFKGMVESMQDVTFVVGDPELNGENLIWDQLPGPLLPRVLLVNREGVVVDIDVPVSEVKTQSGFLLTQ